MTTTDVVKVLLPIIRRAMPSIIAHHLVGVQPMSAPTGSIFTLKARYQTTGGMILLTRAHFRHFLRVYNRRKSHSFNSIRDLGYPVYQILGYNQWSDVVVWCRKNLEEGAFIVTPSSEIIFANHSDYLHFVLEVG
jgi:hypothetical protein